MTISELLNQLECLNVRLETRNGRLQIDAPVGAIDDELRAALVEHKPALLKMLKSSPAWDGMTVPIYTSEASVMDFYQLKRQHCLTVVSCKWEGKGPLAVVVTGPPSLQAISESARMQKNEIN